MVRGLRGLREADEFLYDPNDELAKARAAFGKK